MCQFHALSSGQQNHTTTTTTRPASLVVVHHRCSVKANVVITRCDCFLLLTVSIIDHGRHHHRHHLHCLIAILCVNGIVVVFLVIASDIFILVFVFLVVMRTVHQWMNLCAKTCCFCYNIIGFLCWLLLLLVVVLVWPSHVTIYIILYILYILSHLSIISFCRVSSLHVSLSLSLVAFCLSSSSLVSFFVREKTYVFLVFSFIQTI